jgi:hypothetical protein
VKPQLSYRAVKLELVRSGEAHNQLLSPLTPYVALCGDQRQATVNVGWEHRKWLRVLTGLRYQAGERQADLREVQEEVTRLMSRVPGLHAAVGGNLPVWLRLVLTPEELSMLPFEGCFQPDGASAGGKELLVDSDRAVVMTREVRAGTPIQRDWPARVKVLFVAARPDGVPPIPFEAHLLALRRTLRKWIGPAGCGRGKPGAVETVARDHAGAPLLDVLQDATVDALAKACLEGDYTHVHLLAHGAAEGERFGVALQRPDGGPDVVDGERLARAIRARMSHPGPAVVTLAVCDSGAKLDVLYPAVSVAHALHVEGVPFVVGSQLPLSQRGSVRLVYKLYETFAAGWDPLWSMHAVRRELYRHRHESHDWASVVAYARFPTAMPTQLAAVRLARIGEQFWAASRWADEVGGTPRVVAQIKNALGRMARWREDEPDYLQDRPDRLVQAAGRHGTALRRLAELAVKGGGADWERESRGYLYSAQEVYREAVDRLPHHPWTTGQFLSVRVILGESDDPEDDELLWSVAWRESARSAGDPWAAADRLELALLGTFWFPHRDAELRGARTKAVALLRQDAARGGYLAGVVERQLLRYAEVWAKVREDSATNPGWSRVVAAAEEARGELMRVASRTT